MALLTKQHMHSCFLHKTPKEGFLAGHSSGELGQAPDHVGLLLPATAPGLGREVAPPGCHP